MKTKTLIEVLLATVILASCTSVVKDAPTETAIPTLTPSPTRTAIPSPTTTVLSVPMSQPDSLTSMPRGLIVLQGCYRESDLETGPCPYSVWLYDQFGDSQRLPFLGYNFSLSHDYKMGSYEASGDIWLLDLSNGENKNITNTVDCYEENPTWSPDNKSLAFLGCEVDAPRDVFMLDIPSGKTINITKTPDRREVCYLTSMEPPFAECLLGWWRQQPNFIFAGSIVFNVLPTKISIDGSNYMVLNESSGSDNQPALSPDGKLLAYDGGHLFNLETSEQEVLFPLEYGLSVEASDKSENPQLIKPSWSPDGKQIAWIGHVNSLGDNGLYVFDISNHEGKVLHTYDAYRWSRAVITWSPDGQWITLSDSEWNEKSDNPITKENTFLWLFSRDGNTKVRIDNCTHNIGVPIWSPDNTKLVFSRRCIANGVPQTIQVFDINTLEVRQIDAPGNSYPIGWLQP